MFDVKTASIDEFIAEAKRLRAEAESAGAKYLILLYRFETEREKDWKCGGIETYAQFVGSYSLTEWRRYTSFCRGLQMLGYDFNLAVKLGEAGTVGFAVSSRPLTDANREKVEDWAGAYEEVNGSKPGEQTAREQARILNPPAQPSVVRQQSELHRLRAENAQLRAELKAKEKLLQQKDEEIARLKKKPVIEKRPEKRLQA